MFLGPFKMHEHLTDNPQYELFFDWDESFDDRGLTITKVVETDDGPGAAIYLSMNRVEAKVLRDYLNGVLLYRPRPEGY